VFSASILAQTASFTAFSASVLTFTGSAATRLGALEAATGSLYSYTSSLNNQTASFATTGSNTFIGTQTITGSVLQSGSFTSTGTLTAQTLVVQTITSSVVYSSGSNIFGNDVANSQTFTGSVLITGSLALAGNITSNGTAVILGSGTTNYLPKFTGTSTIGNSIIQDNGTNVGIGALSSYAKFNISTGDDNQMSIGTTSTGQTAAIFLADGPSTSSVGYKWEFGKTTANNFFIYSYGTASNVLSIAYSTGAATFSSSVVSTQLAINTTISDMVNIVNVNSSGRQGIRLDNGINASGGIVVFNSASSTGTETGGLLRIHQQSTSLSQPTAIFRQDGSANILQLQGAAGAVRLTIASTGAATFSSSVTATTLTANNTSGGAYIGATGATTQAAYGYFANTSGGFIFGTEGSAGGAIFTGSSAYSGAIGTYTAKDMSFGTNGVERMRITSGGNVGIGITNPGAKLQVKTSTSAGATDAFYIENTSAALFEVRDDGLIYMKGNVGIGIAAPSSLLHTYTTVAADNAGHIQYENGNTGTGSAANAQLIGKSKYGTLQLMVWENYGIRFGMRSTANGGAGGIYFTYGNDSVGMTLTGGGNVGIGTTSPTGKLMIEATGNHLFLRASSATAGKYWNFDVTSANQLYIVNNAGTQYLTITDGGNVGIGTASPVGKLDISTGGNTNVVISNDSVDTGYNIISLNGTRTKGSYVGLAGGGTGDSNLYLNSAGGVIVQTGASYAQRMSITSGGNVLIGTTTDSGYKLDVNGTGRFSSSSTNQLTLNGGTTVATRLLVARGTDDSSQNLLLGWNSITVQRTSVTITDPQTDFSIIQQASNGSRTALYIASTGAATFSGDITIGNTSVAGARVINLANSSNIYQFGINSGCTQFEFINGAPTIVATINGATGVYTALSDINKKKDFEASTIGLKEVLQLKPTLYRFKDGKENAEKDLGFIAQEVKEFIPQAYVDNDGFIGLDYQAITATLVKAVQELKQEIDTLKNK
jgi:hypothetical protein